MPAEDAALLLRADPLRWTAPAQAALGTSFAEVWRTIWAVPVSYRMPEARAAVMLPVMADLPLEDEGAHSLILWRAEELMNAGQTLEANALLGLMLATSSEHTWRAWLLIARLRHMRGDTAGAREALTTWLAQAPEPERALDLLYADERLRELAPPERPPAPALTLDDVREAYESSR